jgi:PAS domain S-box-containing protein
MKIKERLRLNTWISLGAIVFMCLAITWSLWEVYRADRNMLLIDEMQQTVFDRIFLKDDYLLNRNEQTGVQWSAKSETLRALLESASERFTGTEDKAHLQEARKSFNATFSLFSRVLEKHKQKERAEGNNIAFDEAETRLINQVSLNVRVLNDSIGGLHESSRRTLTKAYNRGGGVIVIFIMGTVIAIIINSTFIRRIVVKRVTTLHEGVEIIGGGNLDYRIDEVGDDELSDLARASNEMVIKLKASQEYSESIINTVREPLIALDQDLRVVTASRSFYEFFKVNPEETVGQLIYDLGNKQWDIPKLRELLETILPQQATFDNYEVEHDFASIGRRTMLLNARQIQRALGKERIILLAIEDITERKEIESGLEKTRKELEAIKISEDEAHEYAESIINTVREPLIALDQDLRVVTASRSFYEFFKVNPEETMGQLIYDLGNKQWDIPKLRELLETVLPQKATFDNYEVEHDFATIGRRIMLLNARQIQRVLGKERIILLAIEDITERKEIESGLEKTRKELEVTKISEDAALEYAESVINSVREPLIALDQDLRVVKVSRSFYDFFKVNAEETMGQLIYDLGNKQWDIPKLRELLETILPEKASFDDYEVEHDFATIGRRIMLLNARQIQRVLGKERIILLAIEDITEKKKLEREVMKERDVAESSNKELEAFSYSVSHDLRAPLRSIDGFSQALLEDYQDKLDDTGKNYLDRVRKATQHMGSLIDDMLKLSRLTRSEFHHESVDLSTIVREISEKLQQDNPDKTVDVIIREGVIVNGDPSLLKIVLENLVNNAWKFTSKEAQPQVEFGTTVKEDKTACFIRDNGVGFDMAYVNKLFGAFQRLHTSLEFPGTGIGLATVRRVINRHGGQVWVEAEVGKGATFYFTLPG